jgi:hypothetical protein
MAHDTVTPTSHKPHTTPHELSADEQAVLDALRAEDIDLIDLMRRCGLPSRRTLRAAEALVKRGLAVETQTCRYQLAAQPSQAIVGAVAVVEWRSRSPEERRGLAPLLALPRLEMRVDVARADLWLLEGELMTGYMEERAAAYRARYEAAKRALDAAHASAAFQQMEMLDADGAPSGQREILAAQALLRVASPSARPSVAKVFDLTAYRAARAGAAKGKLRAAR